MSQTNRRPHDHSGLPSDDAAAPEGIDTQSTAAAVDDDASQGRERWLMEQVERDREIMLAMAQALGGAGRRQSRAMRFWRWLIDDYRSERRATEKQGDSAGERLLAAIASLWAKRGILGQVLAKKAPRN
jgi:hypothetical protein